MKIKYKWILLGITVVAIVGLIVGAVLSNNAGNNISNIENTIIDKDDTFTFKIFEYVVPEGLKFSEYGAKRFKIEGNDWYAIVGIVYDEEVNVYNDTEVFQSIIVGVGYAYNIVVGDIITINDTKVVTFKDQYGKGLLCYFASDFGFDYEVEIFNKDGSYKSDALNVLMEPLLNVTYENVDNIDFYVANLE